MSLFSFFKKKKEEIIDIEKIENSKQNIGNEEIKEEEKKEEIKENIKKEEVINEIVDITTIIKKLNEAKKNINPIYHEYYICKIFSRVALDEQDFSAQVIELDKQISKIQNDLHDIERNIDFYNKLNNKVEDEEIRLNERANKLLLQEKIFKQRLLDINNIYYRQLKITTVSVCINRSNEGLEEFFKIIDEIVKKYKNMSDAAYDLYYSSGDFITSFVKEMVSDFKLTGNSDYINKYTYSFFLNSDVVITLDINEWIELYNKVKFAYKSLANIEIDAYLRLKEKYDYFEAIYTILQMQSEISRNKVR